MTTATEITQRNHRRAVRFFWCLLLLATLVSLVGNIAHAVLPYLSHVVIQIGAAAVPPIALLAAVHGIALAVRAGASGTVYRWAVSAVAVIGVGAFALSFIALRDLIQAIGYSPATAWIFPAIIDTAVGVATMMLVALGDKPPRRVRTGDPSASAKTSTVQKVAQPPVRGANVEVPGRTSTRPRGYRGYTVQAGRVQTSAPTQAGPAQTMQGSMQTEAIQADADLAAELIETGVTIQPVETVIAVLAATHAGASINAAAKAAGVNYRTAQRIVEGAAERRQRQLTMVG